MNFSLEKWLGAFVFLMCADPALAHHPGGVGPGLVLDDGAQAQESSLFGVATRVRYFRLPGQELSYDSPLEVSAQELWAQEFEINYRATEKLGLSFNVPMAARYQQGGFSQAGLGDLRISGLWEAYRSGDARLAWTVGAHQFLPTADLELGYGAGLWFSRLNNGVSWQLLRGITLGTDTGVMWAWGDTPSVIADTNLSVSYQPLSFLIGRAAVRGRLLVSSPHERVRFSGAEDTRLGATATAGVSILPGAGLGISLFASAPITNSRNYDLALNLAVSARWGSSSVTDTPSARWQAAASVTSL